MPFFSKVFKGGNKETAASRQPKENGAPTVQPPKARWDDAWLRTSVEPEEVQELLRECTQEIKARALNVPFLILPFRPASDPSAAKAFIRNFFGDGRDPDARPSGDRLLQELRLVEPLVLCSVCKWCWGRLSGGVITWEAYELFTIGEKDSNQARDAFNTFIPMSVASPAREKIIFDFFELLAAVAAHGKANGLGGRKLSRLAGWWAFEHVDTSNGFESGYKSWVKAADATSHLFFAYLRSLAPNTAKERSGVTLLPRALEALLDATDYPPTTKPRHQMPSSKVAMIVENVSPTPFALLRRAKDFRYRDEDHVLQQFSNYDEPSEALTDECRRVLRAISSANDTSSAKTSTSLRDPSWSRFEDIGFSALGDDSDESEPTEVPTLTPFSMPTLQPTLRSAPQSRVNLGRPTTPSWADFLSTGFVDEKYSNPAVLLPPDKVLPPLNMRAQSSQSQRRMTDDSSELEPGELANITHVILDDAFWWTWITSLAGEEAPARKAVFGRCALIETRIYGSSWLVMEEIVKGAAPEPEAGTYVAEKKSRFTFGKKLSRSKTSSRGANMPRGGASMTKVGSTNSRQTQSPQPNRNNVAPDQQARIQAAAAALQEKKRQEMATTARRGRIGDSVHQKTQSVATLQSTFVKEATPAMKWANSYDKNTIRAKYLGNEFAGRGSAVDLKEVLGAGDAVARAAQSPAPSDRPRDATVNNAERLAAPPRDSSLKHEQGPVTAASNSDQRRTPPPTNAEGKGETSPQAANFFASQMPRVAQQQQDSKALPTPPPENRPPPPSKQDNQASAAVIPPRVQSKPTQRPGEQVAASPQQAAGQPFEKYKTLTPALARQPEEQKTELKSSGDQAKGRAPGRTTEVLASGIANKENQAPLQQARSKNGGDPAKAPATPDHPTQAGPESPPSPESSKFDRNKLRKRERTTGKGIKNIFKLRKAEDEQQVEAQSTRPAANTSSSVAAARAALEAKAKEGEANTPSPANRVTTKRYSTGGKNGQLEEVAPTKPVARVEPRTEARASPRPVQRDEPATQPREAADAAAATGAGRSTSTAQSSQVDSAEEKHAQEAFGSFDQGGVEPHTPTHAEATRKADPEAPNSSTTAEAAVPKQESVPAVDPALMETPKATAKHTEPTSEAVSADPAKDTATEANEPTMDAGDRWAQIRKNAAERAARMSEDKTTAPVEQANRADDDGETSGEETIESRVARIKARVAELTGNMDHPPAYKA